MSLSTYEEALDLVDDEVYYDSRYEIYSDLREHIERMETERGQLESENAKLRKLVRDYDSCLDAALYLVHNAGYPVLPDQDLFNSLRPRMRELGMDT